MSNYLQIAYTNNELIFGEQNTITLNNLSSDFIAGFKCYIQYNTSNVSLKSNITKYNQSYLNNKDNIRYGFYCGIRYGNEADNIEYQNSTWKNYMKLYNISITKRYSMLCTTIQDQLIFEFDSIDFLKGFRLAYTYQSPTINHIRIEQVRENHLWCREYVKYEIDISVRSIANDKSKYIKDDPKNLECRRVLNGYLHNDVIMIVLEYYIVKECRYGLYEYYCETLCDYDGVKHEQYCRVCKILLNADYNLKYDFDGDPFMIDIRLETISILRPTSNCIVM